MQHDEMIWATLNQHFCAFKVTTARANFCRQKYNVSGMCNRSSCPLANSRYATILERNGGLVLHIKTIERAHSPKNLWQKLKLSKNYAKALAQIDAAMQHWPPFLIHKAKQRLTKMTQFLLRKRRLLAGAARTVAVPIKQKTERRDAARERKAVRAAKLDTAIEAELLNRLKSGAYGDIYNFPRKQYERALGADGLAEGEEAEEKDEEEEEGESDEYESDEDEGDDEGGAEFEAADDSSDGEDSSQEESEVEAEMEHEYEDDEESEGEVDSSSDDGGRRPAAARGRDGAARVVAAAADGGDDTDGSGSGSGSDIDDANGGVGADARGTGGGRPASAAAGTPLADLEDPPPAADDVFAFDDGSDLEADVAAAGGDERAALRSRSRKRLAAAAPAGAARPAAGAAGAAAGAAGAAAPRAGGGPKSKRVRFSASDDAARGSGAGGGGGGGGGGAAPPAPATAAAKGRSARRGLPRRPRAPPPAAPPAGVRVEVEVETEQGETVWEAADV